MQDSIFTKIINGEIPSFKIYEDDQTFAFLDIHPITPGHVLVVPKKQIEFLWDLDEVTYAAIMNTTKKLAQHLRSTLEVPFVGEQVIGIDVPHAHVHLIPFSTPQEYHHRPDTSVEPDFAALTQMADRIRID